MKGQTKHTNVSKSWLLGGAVVCMPSVRLGSVCYRLHTDNPAVWKGVDAKLGSMVPLLCVGETSQLRSHPNAHRHTNHLTQIHKCIRSQTDTHTPNWMRKQTGKQKSRNTTAATEVCPIQTSRYRSLCPSMHQWTNVSFCLAESRVQPGCTAPAHCVSALGCYWLTFFNQACQVSCGCPSFVHKWACFSWL